MLVCMPVVTATTKKLAQPHDYSEINAPTITSPIVGVMGNSYEYTITYNDPQGDDIYYRIIWGDCEIVYKHGPHKSGEEIKIRHAWCNICHNSGKFTIRVKAFDDNNEESNWGRLEVTMNPKIDITFIFENLYQLIVRIIDRFPLLEKLMVK